MEQSIKVYPLLTYSQDTQSLSINRSLLEPTLALGDTCQFVNVIDVRFKDYSVFTSLTLQAQIQSHGRPGIYVSDPVPLTSPAPQGSSQSIRYLMLPANQGRVAQKYQDLFAGLMLGLSRTAIFDISSKFVRSNRASPEGRHYVVMNTNGGELYRASIQPHTNKMEICHRVARDSLPVLGELAGGLPGDTQDLARLVGKLERTLLLRGYFRHYLNFEQLLCLFGVQLRLQQHLLQTSKHFQKLTRHRQKLSLKQMQALQQSVEQFQSPEFSGQQQVLLLRDYKRQLRAELQSANASLSQKFMCALKQDYFASISSASELSIKKQLAQKILVEYGIPGHYISLVTAEVSETKYKEAAKHSAKQIAAKDARIVDLLRHVEQHQKLLAQNQELLRNYEDKNLDFKELNNRFIEKCNQLQVQRTRVHQGITLLESLKTQIQHLKTQKDVLYSSILELKSNKEKLLDTQLSLQSQLRNKQNCIRQLQARGQELEARVQNYHKLQSRAWKSIEQLNQMQLQFQGNQDVLSKLQQHFEEFKSFEAHKFNYILKSNYEQLQRISKQCQLKDKMIRDQAVEMGGLHRDLQEERLRNKFMQQHLTKRLTPSPSMLSLASKSAQNQQHWHLQAQGASAC